MAFTLTLTIGRAPRAASAPAPEATVVDIAPLCLTGLDTRAADRKAEALALTERLSALLALRPDRPDERTVARLDAVLLDLRSALSSLEA